MPSSFTWLDYSEYERSRMLDVVALFTEQETRDELGIGSVRDAFADLLFPGTSTVQTRARYFLFIPWIYQKLERYKVASNEIVHKGRDAEVRLIDALAKEHPGKGEGVIGVSVRAELKRLPSNIYWLGLRAWGVRLFPGSQDQYHRFLDRFYRQNGGRRRSEEGEPDDSPVTNWHSGIPDPPAEFPAKANFQLTRKEADYLRERIMATVPDSLLAFLVDKGRIGDRVDFPWQHPQFGQFSARNREQLEHARNFSEVIHGAALLYNLMLAEKADRKEQVDEFLDRLKDWAKMLAQHESDLNRWERERFWDIVKGTGARLTNPTCRFINSWLDMALGSSGARRIHSNSNARELIQWRERTLKRGLARLESRRALELWNGEAGTGRLDFRWAQASTIITDILKGQKGGAHA